MRHVELVERFKALEVEVELALIEDAQDHALAEEHGNHRDVDVALAPYPPPGSLADQLTETLRQIALQAVPSVSLPGLAGRMQDWLAAAPVDVPALVPPFVLDIR